VTRAATAGHIVPFSPFSDVALSAPIPSVEID
jgi:hypothetical protein